MDKIFKFEVQFKNTNSIYVLADSLEFGNPLSKLEFQKLCFSQFEISGKVKMETGELVGPLTVTLL